MVMSKETFLNNVKKTSKKTKFKIANGKIVDRWGRGLAVSVAKTLDKTIQCEKNDNQTAAQALGVRSDTASKISNACGEKCQRKNKPFRQEILEACGVK
jgi:hypothetical protein